MPWLLGGYMWLYLHRPFEYWTFLGTMQVERLYMLIVMAVWLIHPGKKWIQNRLHGTYLLFGFVLLTCWLSSPYPQYLGEKIVENFAKVGVFYVLLVSSIRDEKGLRQMLMFYFIALGLYQCHSFWEFLNGRHERRMATIRMMGIDLTYGNPNTFAATILHALPFLVPFWLYPKSQHTRKVIVGYVLLSLGCIFLTGSRRAFLGICLIIGVMVIRSKHRLALILLLIFSSPIVWSMMRPDLQNRILTIVSSDYGPSNAHTSAISRYYFFLDGLELYSQHPITGVGPAAFGAALPHGMQAHNLYAQTMAELGTLGLIALAVMVFGFWNNSREMKRLYSMHYWWEKDFTWSVGRITWFAVVLLLFMGIGGHNLYRYNWLWFGAFQAVAIHIGRQKAGWEGAMNTQAYSETEDIHSLNYQPAY